MKIRKQFLLLFISTSHLFVYAQNTEPSMFTKEANEQVVKSLPFDNKQDFEDANRGFFAPIDGYHYDRRTFHYRRDRKRGVWINCLGFPASRDSGIRQP